MDIVGTLRAVLRVDGDQTERAEAILAEWLDERDGYDAPNEEWIDPYRHWWEG